MVCPVCGDSGVRVEGLPNGGKRVRCFKCGLDEVFDAQERRLLVEMVRDGVAVKGRSIRG